MVKEIKYLAEKKKSFRGQLVMFTNEFAPLKSCIWTEQCYLPYERKFLSRTEQTFPFTAQ